MYVEDAELWLSVDVVWETAPMLFWIIKHNKQTEVRLVEYDDFTVLISPCVYMAIFSFPPLPWMISG